jgi:hypothetical protein
VRRAGDWFGPFGKFRADKLTAVCRTIYTYLAFFAAMKNGIEAS